MTALTLRELNRATLARQLLLERIALDVPTAVHRPGALQAQRPRAPYVALAARLEGFEREDLTRVLHDREREAELALAVLEPVASRFEVEVEGRGSRVEV